MKSGSTLCLTGTGPWSANSQRDHLSDRFESHVHVQQSIGLLGCVRMVERATHRVNNFNEHGQLSDEDDQDDEGYGDLNDQDYEDDAEQDEDELSSILSSGMRNMVVAQAFLSVALAVTLETLASFP